MAYRDMKYFPLIHASQEKKKKSILKVETALKKIH